MRKTVTLSRPSQRRSHQQDSSRREYVNWVVTVGSALLCLLLLPMRIPGMELLGIAPNWLLIWVVAWSIKRTVIQGAIAGLVLGLIQDGMTSPDPTHVLGLAIVGVLTARLQKQRYLQEDFISVALIVFGMTILAETIATLQFGFFSYTPAGTDNLTIGKLAEIWQYRQQITLTSAIVTSLWAPIVYYPLNHWWK